MKILKTYFIFFVCFAVLCLPVSAVDNQRSWCFKWGESGQQPTFPDGNDQAKDYGALYLGPQGDKTIYLTFDAGYSNESLEKTLDVLKAQSVQGAFFILPGIIKHSPEVVKRMSDEGHLICNHSYSHGNMANITDLEEFQKELTDLEDYCKQELGITVEKYFRPPQGSYSQSTLEFCKQLEYTPVFWSFAYADWSNKQQLSPEKALEKMKSKIHDGMVVLLHPTSATNGAIIEDFIISAKEMGYSFGSLHDLKLKINS